MYRWSRSSALGLLFDFFTSRGGKGTFIQHLLHARHYCSNPRRDLTSVLVRLTCPALHEKPGFQQEYEPRSVSLQSLCFSHTTQLPPPLSPHSFLGVDKPKTDECLSFHWCHNTCGGAPAVVLRGLSQNFKWVAVYIWIATVLNGGTCLRESWCLSLLLFFNWIKSHLGLLSYSCEHDQILAEK